jgi:serine/threonine-protein kinase
VSRKLTAGSSLAQYRIVRLLGEGGMGAVYEALDESLDRHVAIKTLLSDVAQDPESRKRFFREGKAAARLRHPHVVEVYGVGIENEIPYLVMELLDGESLAATLDRDKSLAPERAIETLLPVLSALVTAHQEGVIHRDLKPDNIFLQKTRARTVVPKLLDFGISKVTGAQNSRITHTSALMGTPYYMSPEQARGSKDVDARIDQWAMGVILYEALAGERPVQGESVLEILHRIAMMPIRPLAVPGVPPELASVVMRALERDPARRWPSIAALGHALLPFASAGTRSSWAAAFACGTPDSMHLEEAASEREVAATVKMIQNSMIGLIAFGKMCLNMMFDCFTPIHTAASTNSFCLSEMNVARTIRAVDIHAKIPTITTTMTNMPNSIPSTLVTESRNR